MGSHTEGREPPERRLRPGLAALEWPVISRTVRYCLRYFLRNSTRRFPALPSGVSFDPIGWAAPEPLDVSRPASTPNCATSTDLTASARRFERSRLWAASPTESVYPSISSFRLGFLSNPPATCLSIGAESGFSRSLSGDRK